MSEPGQEYLRDVVMSAPPEKLHLMLYDGAIRFCRQARDAIESKDIEGSYNLLTRVQNIVMEMQNALKPEVDPILCQRMSALYSFVYRRLVDANVNKDRAALDEALQVLEYQRETWAMLLTKLAEEQGGSETDALQSGSTGSSEPALSVEG